MEKTFIQEELFQFTISHFKGKEYKEQIDMISQMQDFLSGIKDALIAKNTIIECNECKQKTSAILWNTNEEEVKYTKNLNNDYNEDDEFVKIRANRIYGICPNCKKSRFLSEKILETIPIKNSYL